MKPIMFMQEGIKSIKKVYTALLLLAAANFVMLMATLSFASKAASRKPVVIRVSELGRAEALTTEQTYSDASDVEIRYLAKFIVENLFSFSRLTYKQDFERILPYLSPSIKEDIRQIFRELTAVYLKNQAKVNARVFSVELLSEPSAETVQVRVDYWKEVGNTRHKRYCIMVFRKITRTLENPFGLVVEELRERAYLMEGGEK